MSPERHHVYRVRDKVGRLLYVGVTRDVRKRLAEHRRDSWPWWDAYASHDSESFPDRGSAEKAEQAAIATERPALNVFHAADRASWKARGWLLATIGVEPQLWATARRVCHARGESLNDVIGAAIGQHVARHKHLLDGPPTDP